MRTHTRISLIAALVLLPVVLPGASQSADARTHRARAEAARQTQPFMVSGTFTGVLDQEMTMDGETYWLAPDAQFYEIGKGQVMQGSVVSDRHVFLSGTRRGDSVTINMVVLRPESEDSSNQGGDGSQFVSIARDDRPR
ncbi:MAG TPA: hypothetical protein VMJ70_02020 [Candidatus Sulfotelmatobacter sp.]|nr:hypothetical protein [Candidatus Sulfotelmatobacter sp.]